MAVLNQILLMKKYQKQARKAIFSTILAILAGKHNSEHSAATSAVVFWTDVGESLYFIRKRTLKVFWSKLGSLRIHFKSNNGLKSKKELCMMLSLKKCRTACNEIWYARGRNYFHTNGTGISKVSWLTDWLFGTGKVPLFEHFIHWAKNWFVC